MLPAPLEPCAGRAIDIASQAAAESYDLGRFKQVLAQLEPCLQDKLRRSEASQALSLKIIYHPRTGCTPTQIPYRLPPMINV